MTSGDSYSVILENRKRRKDIYLVKFSIPDKVPPDRFLLRITRGENHHTIAFGKCK